MNEMDVDKIATYIESLKMHLRDNSIKDPRVRQIVSEMPTDAHVRRQISHHEGQVLFESVRWAWKEITGSDLKEQMNFEAPPEALMGNYWMMKNGLLLHGVNHYIMIKRNLSLFSTLLNVDSFVLHEKLASPPHEIIKLMIDNGGVRIFVTADKRAYFQMNDSTYNEWGRAKVKGLDFSDKVVNLVDPKAEFNGWKSGISIKL